MIVMGIDVVIAIVITLMNLLQIHIFVAIAATMVLWKEAFIQHRIILDLIQLLYRVVQVVGMVLYQRVLCLEPIPESEPLKEIDLVSMEACMLLE